MLLAKNGIFVWIILTPTIDGGPLSAWLATVCQIVEVESVGKKFLLV
jgi:hypothetical protein